MSSANNSAYNEDEDEDFDEDQQFEAEEIVDASEES